MIKDYSAEEIEFMENVSAEEMTEQEAKYYQILLQNCKDIMKPIHPKIKGSVGTIVRLEMERLEEANEIKYEAMVAYSTPENERKGNSCINGSITMSGERIVVEMNVTLLTAFGNREEYVVIDEFGLKEGKVTRRSYYGDCVEKKYRDNVEIEWRGNKL